MNHMKEVAALLGVEIGEEFTIKEYSKNRTFKIERQSLYEMISPNVWTSNLSDFLELVTGDLHICKKPWKPKNGDTYWYIDNDGNVCSSAYLPCTLDVLLVSIGNYYRTKKDAEANVDKWKKYFIDTRIAND